MSNVFIIHTKYPVIARHVAELVKRVISSVRVDKEEGGNPYIGCHNMNQAELYVYGTHKIDPCMSLNDCMDVIKAYGLTKLYNMFYCIIKDYSREEINHKTLERILCNFLLFRLLNGTFKLEEASGNTARLLTIKEPLEFQMQQDEDESDDD